jgi:hypothetical protein
MYRISFIILVGLIIVSDLNAQKSPDNISNGAIVEEQDSLSSEEIIFTPASASAYIIDLLDMESLWKPGKDNIRIPLNRLIEQYDEPYDSIENRLWGINYHPTSLRKVDTLRNDTLSVRWLNDSTFIIDTVVLGKEPLFVQKTVVKQITAPSVFIKNDSTHVGHASDTIKRAQKTIISKDDNVIEMIIDTALLKSKNVQLYQIKNNRIVPRIFPAGSKYTYHFLGDGSKIIISKPVQLIVADKNSPLHVVPNEKLPDSLSAAVQTLLSYTDRRDSILLYLNNIDGLRMPFWLTVGDDELQRYWISNQKNDSVSIWLGNPDKRNITLTLEDDIQVERIEKETVDDVPFVMATPRFKLAEIKQLKEIPIYWDYDFSCSLSLNENYLSNWVKGGDNSISSIVDIKGQAKYTKQEAQTEWTNNVRLKYGSIITDQYGLRKNTDILELDSKFNKTIRKKIDLSALFHMNNQIAKGYNYPTDSTKVLVSKFMNPGTFTIGIGFEYKPIKKSTINFSVLSYKNTFVLDTAAIDDHTIHGIDKDKRAKQEMGGQVLIKSELNLLDDMKLNNSIRLFSNYLDKPENIDVEWEMELQKQISMYFTIQLNIHIIYDDDILTPVLKNNKPVLLPDGTEKKTAQMQFKQFLGLTFLIKL